MTVENYGIAYDGYAVFVFKYQLTNYIIQHIIYYNK